MILCCALCQSLLPGQETASDPLPRSFMVKALSDFVSANDEEWLLCAVRSLRFHLDRLKTVSPPPCSLFVSQNKGSYL